MSAELEALESQAAVIDAETAAPDAVAAAPDPESVKVDVAAEVATLLETVAGILTPAFPCLASIYNTATCRRLGEASAPVLDKYGLSVGGLFERWGAEITFAAVAFPVVAATVQGVKADLAARRAPPTEPPAPANQSAYAEERAA